MESQSPVQPPTSSEVNQTPVVPTATAPTSTQPRPEPTPAPSDVAPTAPTVSNTTQNHVSETTEGSLQQPDAVASKTEGEAEVTMPQVLQTLEQLETIHKTLEDEAAGQAEGWGVEGVCTYDKGYCTQPVYACKTCAAKVGPGFGFCFGCSMSCHLDHEVVELFSKRGFRCDCATPKAPFDNPCLLHDRVPEKNDRNRYNHNFNGLYCWCNKPYKPEDTMLQCGVCQDWFHDRCISEKLKNPIPDGDNDYICRTCVVKYEFLRKYPQLIYDPRKDLSDAEDDMTSNGTCKIDGVAPSMAGDKFFFEGWETHLCRCAKCIAEYQKQGVSYLIETEPPEDVSDVPRRPPTASDPKVTAQQTFVDQVQQVEFARGYQVLKRKLDEVLKSVQEEGRAVSLEDIARLRAELDEHRNKKPRLHE